MPPRCLLDNLCCPASNSFLENHHEASSRCPLALAALAVIVTAGCAAPEDDSQPPAARSPRPRSATLEKDETVADLLPADIKNAGVVRVASGVSFPPMEYFDNDNKTVLGFDADLGKALGEVLGVEFKFQNTNFDGIIGGLKAGRYDLGLTSMIDKKERQAEVDFVDYLSSGVTFMVAKGNPEGLTEQTGPVRQDRRRREERHR